MYAAVDVAEILWEEQDLTELCHDRPLVTNELFRLNSYYGLDKIVKAYAGFAEDDRLRIVLPHGVAVFPDLRPAYLAAPLPAVWCYPPFLRDGFERVSDKQVMVNASPYLYLVEMLPKAPSGNRAGTLFFPAHSTRLLTAEMDVDQIIGRLKALPPAFHPITICLYWKDVLDGRQLQYKAAGFKVVSAGHMFDPHFLTRLHYLCSSHEYASSNAIGTHIWYSMQSGCSFFLLDTDRAVYRGDPTHMALYRATVPQRREARLRRLFARPAPQPSTRQMLVLSYMLGARYLMSQSQLARSLRRLRWADTFGYVRHTSNGSRRLVLSPAMKRTLGRVRTVIQRTRE
jgi:hypothetical protein